MFFALSGGQYGAHTDPHHLIDSDKEKTDRFKGDGDRYFIFEVFNTSLNNQFRKYHFSDSLLLWHISVILMLVETPHFHY